MTSAFEWLEAIEKAQLCETQVRAGGDGLERFGASLKALCTHILTDAEVVAIRKLDT